MRYLTHIVLHRPDSHPHREVRDSFGLDSAACFCGVLTSPAVPAAYALAKAAAILHPRRLLTRKPSTNTLTLHPEFSLEDVSPAGTGSNASLSARESLGGIELRDLAHSRSRSPSATSGNAASSLAASPPPPSSTWLTPPPPALHPSKPHNPPTSPLNNLPPLPPNPPTIPSQ